MSKIPISKGPWYGRTEAKLYNYPNIESTIAHLKAQMELLKVDMAPPKGVTYRHGPPSTADPMTEPESYADKRARHIGRIEAKIRLKEAEAAAIKAALDRLGAEELELVQKWYFEDWRLKRPDRKIWNELCICQSEFYDRKNDVVYKVAVWLGEVEDVAMGE